MASRQSNLVVKTSKPFTDTQLKQMLIEQVKVENLDYGLYLDDVMGGFTYISWGVPNSFKVSPVSISELEQEMLTLSEEVGLDYGIIIERLDGSFERLYEPSLRIFLGGNVGLTLDGLSAYKLFKDGRREVLRQVQLPRFDIRAFKDIVAAADDYTVYHGPRKEAGMSFFFNKKDTNKYNISSFVTSSLLFEELSVTPQEDNYQSLPVGKQNNETSVLQQTVGNID